MTPDQIYILAGLAGILPAVFWLLFWLREDKVKPEPARVIVGAFLLGAVSALFMIPIQSILIKSEYFIAIPLVITFFLAFAEEIAKYISVKFSSLKDIANDEIIDPTIYMITAALGFAALENTLYMINFLGDLSLIESFINGSKRFIGATVVHVVCSAFVGFALSFTYYKKRIVRKTWVIIAMAFAGIIHTTFNYFVSSLDTSFEKYGFYFIWIMVLIVLVIFEILKRINRRYELPDRDLFKEK